MRRLGMAAVVAVAAGSGCANDAALQQEVTRLRRELQAVRKDVASNKEHLHKVEGQVSLITLQRQLQPDHNPPAGGAPRSSAVPRSDPAAPLHRPRAMPAPTLPKGRSLPVVRLGAPPPESDGWVEPGAQDDGSPPVEIRLGPSSAAPPISGAEERLKVDRSVLNKPDPVLHRRRASKQAAREEYRRGLRLLRVDKKPAEALVVFDGFLRAHPRSDLADNATYWRGVALLQQQKHAAAVKVFRGLLKRYPNSSKRPYARLKIGECLLATGKPAQAKKMLRQVLDLHPSSEAAKEASERLGALEGN